LLVVRDVDERDPDVVLDPFQEELHLLSELQVERAERLVEQEHPRAAHQGAGERDPLLLAARELPRLAVLHAFELDEAEHLEDAPAELPAAAALAAQAERDVLEDREAREGRV